MDDYGQLQEANNSRRRRAYIERGREAGHTCLWNDYFSEKTIYSDAIFRRRFRINKLLFMCIVDRLSHELQYFQQIRDATGR